MHVNSVIGGEKVADPQTFEVTWAQDKKLLKFFEDTAIKRFAVRVQHFTFLILVLAFNRIGITLDHWNKTPWWSIGDHIGLIIHVYVSYHFFQMYDTTLEV